MRVGLTGGIGSGKSEVARILAGLGAHIIDADQLARDVVEPGTPGFAEIETRWPQVIQNGRLDRPALAAIVFSDPAQRAALNAIVHPRVRERAAEMERDLAGGVIVHVVPLLFEGEYWKVCDATIVVIAPKDVRIARVQSRDGTGVGEIERRMAAQIDPEEAAQRATYVIRNDAGLAELQKATAEVWQSLAARDSSPPAQSG